MWFRKLRISAEILSAFGISAALILAVIGCQLGANNRITPPASMNDPIYWGKADEEPPRSPGYSWILMSQRAFRDLTDR